MTNDQKGRNTMARGYKVFRGLTFRLPPLGTIGLTALILSLPACDGLFEVQNEQDILEQDLDQEAALTPLVNGVAGDWIDMYDNAINIMGLVSFELIHTGSFPSWRSVETGLMDRISNGNGVYNQMARSIWVADDAARRIAEGFPEARSEPAQVRMYGGLGKVMLADNFCEGTLNGGPAMPPAEFYRLAEQDFSDAMSSATGAGAPDWAMRAQLGRARTRSMLGDHAGALADASAIPAGFRFDAIYSQNSGREQNSVAGLTRTLTRREAGVHPTFYDDPRFIADPRTSFIDRGPNETGPDPTRKYVEQEKYKLRDSPIPISTWQEARLIEAEAELNIGSAERAVALINEVRAFVALDPYEGEMSQSAVMDQLMYERSAELWLQAHRLYDLRRINDPSLAGRDVCFEIGIDEWASNPNLGGS